MPEIEKTTDVTHPANAEEHRPADVDGDAAPRANEARAATDMAVRTGLRAGILNEFE